MAVTTQIREPKRYGDMRANGGGAYSNGNGYSGIKGVSQQTGTKMQEYQQQGYQPTQETQQAQESWQAIQQQKPQGYTSKYQGALDSILQQIQNPQDFKYEFNGDNLFKQYADMYNEMGRQASLNSMGQAAGLTGGYGNSYAAQAGNQAYQQNLLGLYDKGLELRDRAYQQYQDRLANQKDAYSMAADAEDRAYGQYRDEVADWQRAEEQGYNRVAQEREFGYGQYKDMLDYYTGLAQIENAAYNTEAERQEAIRQFEQTFAEQQKRSDQDEAYRRDQLAETQRQSGLDEAYRRDTLSEQQRQYDKDLEEKMRQSGLDEAYRRDTLAEQQRQADLDEAYRQQTLAEQIRQADLDEAYRRENFEWQQGTDLRDYMSSYVMSILQSGKMPSAELLELAGISEEDAKKLKKQLSSGTKKKEEEKKEEEKKDDDKKSDDDGKKKGKKPIIIGGDDKTGHPIGGIGDPYVLLY